MLTPPADLAEGDLRAVLARGWGHEAVSLSYLPIGFGSHHWDLVDGGGTRWFVTVDDLAAPRGPSGDAGDAYRNLAAALTVAVQLRADGHDYVIAPTPTSSGDVLAEFGRFAVAVYPFVNGERFSFGGYESDSHRREVLALLVRLHGADARAASGARVDDFAVPHRDTLERSLRTGWGDMGPFAAPAAAVLAEHADAIRIGLERHDATLRSLANRPVTAVITHGEPHVGNGMRDGTELVLIDWDTTLLAPPERDLWHVDPGDGSMLEAYADATGTRPDPEWVALYAADWDLKDLATYVVELRSPHIGDANDVANLDALRATVTKIVANVAAG